MWKSIIHLLTNYPFQSSVIEKVCNSFTLSSVYVTDGVSRTIEAKDFVTLFLQTLSAINWKDQSPVVVKAAVEVTGSLVDVFDFVFTDDDCTEQLSSFLLLVLDSETYENSKEDCLVAAGHGFPHGFPNHIMVKLCDKGIPRKLRGLVMNYGNMSEFDLSSILIALQEFLEIDPSSSYEYVLESAHFMLLFAAQQFSKSSSVQKALWSVLSKLTRHASQFGEELGPEILAPALATIVREQVENGVSVNPICLFMINYIINVRTSPPFIIYVLKQERDVLSSVLRVLEKPAEEVTSKDQLREVEAVSDLMILFCTKFKPPVLKEIIDNQIITRLEEAALKWPKSCCQSLCEALDKYLSQLPPDVNTLPPAFRQLFRDIPPEFTEAKAQFFSENHLLPFQKLLVEPALLSVPEIREDIYRGIKRLFKSTPDEVADKWLTIEFLELYVTTLSQDIALHKQLLHIFVLASHHVAYNIKNKEKMQILHDLKLHEIAINTCLKEAENRETRTSTLSFINCLLRSYQDFLKDITALAESNLPNILIQLVEQYGKGEKSEIGELFGTLALGLTADKKASNILHEKGFLDKLYPLAHKTYDPMVVRASVHAVGNIALAGHPVKQEILAHNYHETLMTFLSEEMQTADDFVLTACCRVLHILSSGDWAKRQFAEKGLVDITVRLMACRTNSAEICWRPLGLLSSIGFMSLSNRQFVFTNTVIKAVQNLLNTTTDSKVMSYTALVFLAASDLDRCCGELRSLGITDRLQQILSDESLMSNNDLKRWGTSLVEKGQLFTISVPLERLHLENEQLLVSCLEPSITWPSSDLTRVDAADSSSGEKNITLLPLLESYLAPKFPEAPQLTEDAKGQLARLGLKPDQSLFRIGRVYGSSHGLCSNCQKDGSSEELVFRPSSLTPHQYQTLITKGWYRRGGVKLFRYRYNHSLDCSDWETRVLLSEFNHRQRKSYRKVLRRMPEDRLTIETIPTQFVREAYDLYNSYHLVKHEKPRKSEYSYCEHVVNGPLRNQSIDGFEYGTHHQLYRLDGKLVAVGVIDVVPNGIVSIYMWYDMSKEVTKLSFGVYSALKEIEYAQELSRRNPNIKYYYLQGWNGNNHKLSYKANYEPEEFYSPCTVLNWVSGLDGVKQAHEYHRKKKALQSAESVTPIEEIDSGPTLEEKESVPKENDETEVKEKDTISGEALPFDRQRYRDETGLDSVDTSKIVVCLNDHTYMYLRDVIDHYNISLEQRKMIEERYEELVVAVGSELASNMVIDLKACAFYAV